MADSTGSEEVVGPIPEGADADEYDRLRRRVMSVFPYGLYVIGSRDGERRNAMTANWVTQLSFDPRKLVGVSIERTSFTHELIAAGRSFTVNVVPRDERESVRKFTKPVEVDTSASTLNGYAYRDGPSGAPLLEIAAAWVDCRVINEVDCGSHTFFIGEVIAAGFERDEDTPVLRLEDTRMKYAG
ncbi:MAG: flavin reductase family protein [Actinobacteria bacterium]|nr:flavin reductase family protein [Actinomycetota bacterium]